VHEELLDIGGAIGMQEETIRSNFRGFTSVCRTVWNPKTTTAPVVFVGGAFQRRASWGRLEMVVLQKSTVVTVELPGWGDADLLPAHYGIDFLAEALHDVLGVAGHRSVNLFGGSYGSAIAYRLAQLYPELVLRLALVGTMSSIPEHVRSNFLETITLLRAGRTREFAAVAVRIMFCQDPAITITRRKTAESILNNLFSAATPDDSAKYEQNTLRLLERNLFNPEPPINAPVLVATGEHDPLTTPTLCRNVAQTCLDARFTLLRNADHVVHLEVPENLGGLLINFFTDSTLESLPYCHPIEYFGTAIGAEPPYSQSSRA
jgi:pimeloyl-ACP methyl ester carboxylesterase